MTNIPKWVLAAREARLEAIQHFNGSVSPALQTQERLERALELAIEALTFYTDGKAFTDTTYMAHRTLAAIEKLGDPNG